MVNCLSILFALCSIIHLIKFHPDKINVCNFHVFLHLFRWNQLDLLIVILSIIGIILEEMESGVIPVNPTIIRVMRVLRIARGKSVIDI